MTTAIEDIIAAIAGDVDANGGLIDHDTWLSRRARVVLPDQCPLLVVWLNTITRVRATTRAPGGRARLQGVATVTCSWYVATVDEAQEVVPDDTVTRQMFDNLERIEERILYLENNGLPNTSPPSTVAAWQIEYGGTRVDVPDMESGLTEGYAVDVLVGLDRK